MTWLSPQSRFSHTSSIDISASDSELPPVIDASPMLLTAPCCIPWGSHTASTTGRPEKRRPPLSPSFIRHLADPPAQVHLTRLCPTPKQSIVYHELVAASNLSLLSGAGPCRGSPIRPLTPTGPVLCNTEPEAREAVCNGHVECRSQFAEGATAVGVITAVSRQRFAAAVASSGVNLRRSLL